MTPPRDQRASGTRRPPSRTDSRCVWRRRDLLADVAAALIGACAASLALPSLAHAYVDPSVVTYTIQAVAGVAVALGAVLGVAFRRTRHTIYRLLKIDENANKTVDPEVHFLKGAEPRHRAPDAGDEEPEEPAEPLDPEAEAATAILGAIPYVIIENYDARDLYAKRIVPPGGMPIENVPPEELDEPDLESAPTPELADERARALFEEAAHGKPPKRLRWSLRLLFAIAASAFTVSTILVFTPLELVAASSESLTFGFFDVTGLLISVGAIVAFALAFVLSALRGRVFDVTVCVVVAIGLGCFMQALFLNATLPSADGTAFHLADHVGITIIDTLVWVGLFVGLLLFNARKTPIARVFLPFLCVLLFMVQLVSTVGIANDERAEVEAMDDPIVMTTEGLNEVGAEGDVTVFVLDMFDTTYLDEVLATDPSALDEFTGFTLFRNSTGSLIPTRFGLPFLLTNSWPDPNESFEEFEATRYAESPFLGDIANAGYEIGIYTDTVDRSAVADYAMNIYPTHGREFDEAPLWMALEKMSLFREMPWLLKPLFWFYTGDLNVGSLDEYTSDNATYYANIFENGLTVSEDAPRTFRFIHTEGAHWPYDMDANGNTIPEQPTVAEQAQGVINYVEEYLKELKRLGLYDQTAIIITADHGRWDAGVAPMWAATSPIFLVKPVETPEEAAQPLQVSTVPTGHLDYAATVISAVGGDSAAYGPTAFEVPDAPRDRYFWYLTHDGHTDFELLEYLVQGDALDFGTWSPTGRYVQINPGGLTDPAAHPEGYPPPAPEDDYDDEW